MSLVLFLREDIGTAHEFQVVTRVVLLDAAQNVFQTDHVCLIIVKKPRITRITQMAPLISFGAIRLIRVIRG